MSNTIYIYTIKYHNASINQAITPKYGIRVQNVGKSASTLYIELTCSKSSDLLTLGGISTIVFYYS